MSNEIDPRIRSAILAACVLAASVAVMGPGRCTPLERWFSTNPAPDVEGEWDVTYDDDISVEVDVGGSVHDGVIEGDTGTLTFTHDGQEVTLELDCSHSWIMCPSEVFTPTVTLEQRRFQEHPHQVHMEVNTTECVGEPRLPDESEGECDPDDPKRPCDVEVCDEVVEVTETTIGSISDPGDTSQLHPPFDIRLFLGGGLSMPTPNCVLASVSWAEADIEYTGIYDVDATEPTMDAHSLSNGEITTAYGGACFWFESTEYSEDLKAALLGATITLRTGFTADRR
jgi:hypothetical protein